MILFFKFLEILELARTQCDRHNSSDFISKLAPCSTSIASTTSTMAPRQFFVGGNFKMNPVNLESKRALIKVLNEAELDPSVGEVHSSTYRGP